MSEVPLNFEKPVKVRYLVDVLESGEWRVESGEWRVESGEWRVESGEWRVESAEWCGTLLTFCPPLPPASMVVIFSSLSGIVTDST